MRIAFMLDNFPGLSETFILNQITGLSNLGHQIDIFPRQTQIPEKAHPDVDKYGIRQMVRLISSCPQNKFHCRLKALGLSLVSFFRDPLKTIHILRTLLAHPEGFSYHKFFLIVPFILKKYDAIHCHYGPVALRSECLKEVGIKAGFGTVFHGYDLSEFVTQHGAEVYRGLFEKGDLFLPISNYWKEKLLALQCPPEKILVHRMGIDTEKFHYQDRTPDPHEPVRLLTVGRLVEKKGHEYALQAVAEVLRRGKNITYTIVGDGPWEKKLKALTNELRLQEHVRFTGSLRQNTVIEKLMSAHIFLLPSITDSRGNKEGIPVVLMEALATGLPVISTIHSGIPELIQDGVSGFLAPEKNVALLAEKITYLVEHPETWPEMGQAGRKFVEKHYNIKLLNQRLVEIYQTTA